MLLQFLPIIAAYYIESIQNKKTIEEENTTSLSDDLLPYLTLPLADIQASHAIELTRRQQILAKAQANLTAITLATSFVFSVIGLRAKDNSAGTDPLWIVRVLLGMGVLSFLMSGYSSVRAMRIAKSADLWLQARPVGEDATEEKLKETLLKMISINQLVTRGMSNYASASYVHIRNGLFILAIILLVAIFYTGNGW